MTWPGLTQDVERLCSTCHRNKYGMFPPKIAESDPWVMVCVDLVGPIPFTIRTPTKTHSLLALTMIDPATGWFKLSKPQISQQHQSRICFITHGWHITRDLNLLSLTMGVWKNSNVSSNKCVYKKIMALQPNQLQVTTIHTQANAMIERVHKLVVCQ
jgi:hypothetical protein